MTMYMQLVCPEGIDAVDRRPQSTRKLDCCTVKQKMCEH